MVAPDVTAELPYPGDAGAFPAAGTRPPTIRCQHCGAVCNGDVHWKDAHAFCCRGCLTVFELLTENGLSDFYQLDERPGLKGGHPSENALYGFLDEPNVRERLVDYSDDHLTRVSFHIPAIHCIACVWLLENLFRLQPGVGSSRVNFPRKELAICFDPSHVKLSEVVSLLAGLGYEPELRLSALGPRPATAKGLTPPASGARIRRLWLQLGLAGFAFGNTMLLSIPGYFGLDSTSGPGFQRLAGMIGLVLSMPVLVYSAQDYWRSAWTSLRRGLLNIDVPIAVGIIALAAQSGAAVLRGEGVGYFDSLTGLIFFLLCGKIFQQKTFDRLAFDRDYRSFFPLSTRRRTDLGEETVSISELEVGDRLMIRNGELIPADAWVEQGAGLIDYSFVTGESEPVVKAAGDYLYAGGRQIGAAVEVQMAKPVSQGYLTSLWNHEAFRKKQDHESLDNLTNRYSQRFTKLVIGIALGAAAFWAWANPALSVNAFIAVLIVACPCALALAAPFALGAAQRILARRKIFLKNPAVLETLAQANSIVFDKTGTLTAGLGDVTFHGTPLSEEERQWLYSLTRHSTHPQAARLCLATAGGSSALPVRSFNELPGSGMEGIVGEHALVLGSAAWLASHGIGCAPTAPASGSVVHAAIDGQYHGRFQLANALRPDTEKLCAILGNQYDLALLSGDHDSERVQFQALLGPGAELRFDQSPLDKLGFIRQRQESGQVVVMVGDGLNDAGALKQSDVGIAVVENISAFSPASDVIMAAGMVPFLGQITRFSRQAVWVVRVSFVFSALYNLVGLAIAAQGLLAPVICAVLMPVSSVTVVAFACGATTWLGWKSLGAAASDRDQPWQRADLSTPSIAEAAL